MLKVTYRLLLEFTKNYVFSPFFSSYVVLLIIWLLGLWYISVSFPGTAVVDIIPALFVISVFSSLPLLAFILFLNAGGEKRATDRGLTELKHYGRLTAGLKREIKQAASTLYDSRNYRLALPLATLSMAAGWAVFFFWRDVPILGGVPSEQVLWIPGNSHPLVFGFLGVQFWTIQLLFRRYIRGDLTDKMYISISARFWSVVLITMVLSVVWSGYDGSFNRSGTSINPNLALLATSFIVGMFPSTGIQLIKKVSMTYIYRSKIERETELPLSKLKGLNIWVESRLVEEEIENIQNLATCDLYGLCVSSRYNYMSIINWVDQALLFMHSGGQYKNLYSMGIVTATDLEAAYCCQLSLERQNELNNYIGSVAKRRGEFRELNYQLFSYLGRPGISKVDEPPKSLALALGSGEDMKGKLWSIMSAICDDINYQRVWQIVHGLSVAK